MSASYSTIIATIDDAINNWAGQPIQITSEDGRGITYRSLKELIEARTYYAKLQTRENVGGGKGFTITHLKSGGTRS